MCDSCEVLNINGVNCHEHGCPDAWKDYKTECYECTPKPTQKQFPICTIRSTPDKPVHNIVWAKELYKLLFGK